MKGFNFTLRLMQLGGRREGFSNRLPTHLVCQAVVGAMTGLIGQMAMAVGLATAALNGGNGAAAKVAQLQDLVQDGRAMLFQIGDRFGQRASPPYPNVSPRQDTRHKKRKQPNPPIRVAHPVNGALNTGEK